MSERAEHLHVTADLQLQTLIELLSTTDEAAMRRPCPGREKLGDGTIGAAAAHTADNYQRIATFLATSDPSSATNARGARGDHRIPRFMRSLGHRPPTHSQHRPGTHGDGAQYTAESATPARLIERLTAARADLDQIAALTEHQLNTVPPKDSFRFCDGQRTLEQVLAGLLKHQDHQVQMLTGALTSIPS